MEPNAGADGDAGNHVQGRAHDQARGALGVDCDRVTRKICWMVGGLNDYDGSAGMSAPDRRGKALQGPKTSPTGARNGATLKGCA